MTVPSSLLVHERVALDRITLVYRTASGEELTQPLGDIADVGTLIDPDTGDDLELTSALVQLSNPDKPQAFIVPAHFRDVLKSALQQLHNDADDNTQQHERIAALQEKLDHAFPVNFSPAAMVSTDQPADQNPSTPMLIEEHCITNQPGVHWHIDAEPGLSPAEAAVHVWQENFNRGTHQPAADEACVFTVVDETGAHHEIDLSQETYAALFDPPAHEQQ